MPLDGYQVLSMLGAALLAAALATAYLRRSAQTAQDRADGLFQDGQAQTLFLFDGQTMIDSTPQARALLAASPVRGGDWARLMGFLQPRFPDLEARLLQLPTEGEFTLVSTGGDPVLHLKADNIGGLNRFVIWQGGQAQGQDRLTSLAQRAMQDELAMLRQITGAAPNLIWQETAAGDVVWANTAYLQAWFSAHPESAGLEWPLPGLFPKDKDGARTTGRSSFVDAQGNTKWFDVTTARSGATLMCFASSAEATLKAEATLQGFLQTLTKTFAQLPIGLAIFDVDRKLQLFNPAMTDLTGLAVDFLSLRPSLLAVLDALRERKMVPEPKDYRSWRRQVVEMEKAAASGQYEETWSLPNGQTYRVVGRPHPNGALALMIEDISTEILRTRRYRADLELGQAVIDGLETAVAVFAASGQMVMSNRAYSDLWGHDPNETLGGGSVQIVSQCWRAQTPPSRLWSEVEDYVVTVGDRIGWSAEARLLDGRSLTCQLTPLTGGATLITFRPGPDAEPPVVRLADEASLRTA